MKAEELFKQRIRAELEKQTGRKAPPALVDQLYLAIRAEEQKRANTPQSHAEVLDFWRDGSAPGNTPLDYLNVQPDRCRFLLELIDGLKLDDPSICELGCNAGRNLAALYESGYRRLSAVEINAEAVELLKRSFPELAEAAMLQVAPLEQAVPGFGDGEFDVVFSMAVLVHIHTDSDWLFGEIARITGRYLVLVEDEDTVSPRHFKRNYRQVFEGHGLAQVFERDCKQLDGMEFYTTRVFRRAGE